MKKTSATVGSSRRRRDAAIRLAKIEDDQREMRRAIAALRARLAAHDAALRDLSARIARLELLRLEKRQAVL